MEKKGVSPLIATVLLLAFAVALATVIIQLEPFGKCSLTSVDVSRINEVPRVCFNEGKGDIEVFIENKDKKNVVGFRVQASGSNNTLNIENIDLQIGQNQEEKLIIQYDLINYGKLVGLKLYPKINSSNRIQECKIKEDIVAFPSCQ